MKKMFVFSISPHHQSCPIYGQNVGRAWHHTTDYKHTVGEQTRGNFNEKEKKKKKEKKMEKTTCRLSKPILLTGGWN